MGRRSGGVALVEVLAIVVSISRRKHRQRCVSRWTSGAVAFNCIQPLGSMVARVSQELREDGVNAWNAISLPGVKRRRRRDV